MNHTKKLFGDNKEEDELVFTEEEQFLNERGFDIFLAKAWYKKHEDTILTSKGTVRTNFFEWYLSSCNQEQINMLKDELLSEPIRKRLEKAEPYELNIKADSGSPIFESEDEKEELLDTIMEGIDDITVDSSLKDHYEEMYNKYKGYAFWLYTFMSDNMITKEEYIPEPDDIYNTIKIKGDLGIKDD